MMSAKALFLVAQSIVYQHTHRHRHTHTHVHAHTGLIKME